MNGEREVWFVSVITPSQMRVALGMDRGKTAPSHTTVIDAESGMSFERWVGEPLVGKGGVTP